MKKTFIPLISVLAFALPGSLPAEEPELVELTKDVYGFIGREGATNSGFVVTEEGVVVIDAQGPKDLALLLKKKISEVTRKPVIYVINTHYHGDHTFGNQYFKEAKIIAHENTRKNLIEKDAKHRETFKRFFGEKSLEGFSLTLPEITISDTMTLHAGGKTIYASYAGNPAHTDGDIFVYLPSEGILFAGDLLYNSRLPWLADGDTSGWIKTLDSLSAIDARICVPGHGSVGDKNIIKDLKAYLMDMKEEVKRLMEMGKNLEEIKKEISLPKYSNHIKYTEWLPLNAEKAYTELTASP